MHRRISGTSASEATVELIDAFLWWSATPGLLRPSSPNGLSPPTPIFYKARERTDTWSPTSAALTSDSWIIWPKDPLMTSRSKDVSTKFWYCRNTSELQLTPSLDRIFFKLLRDNESSSARLHCVFKAKYNFQMYGPHNLQTAKWRSSLSHFSGPLI